MEKEEWIEQFALHAMASYAAVQYDHNCHVGWREKEQYMHYQDAVILGRKAWDRKEANNG